MDCATRVRRKNVILPVPLTVCDECLVPQDPSAFRLGRRVLKRCITCREREWDRKAEAVAVLDQTRLSMDGELDGKQLASGEREQ